VLISDWGEVRPKAADENAYLESTLGTSTANGILASLKSFR
jgi:hypothetical protein